MPRRLNNSKAIFRRLGASNHCGHDRQENDYYATEPKATELLLTLEDFKGPILEPACGEGHISKVLIRNGYKVKSSDLINRSYGEVKDFLSDGVKSWKGDIITNPPYKYAQEFIEKSLEIIPTGYKIAMFLKVQFLEGKRRRELYKKYPPKCIWVSSTRLKCGMNGVFGDKNSAIAYAWFIWEKGYNGDTIVKWFN